VASNPKTGTAFRQLGLDANFGGADLDSGKYRIYNGTQPADSDTALSGNTLLAGLAFGATAFADASGGSITANAITQDSSADATGTMTFASMLTSADARKHDHTAGISTGTFDAEFNTDSVVILAVVSVSSMIVTQAS